MYNDREKLIHHQQLLSTQEAAADLALLERAAPRHPSLDGFRLSPKRHADQILFALLDVCSRGDIVKNRMAFSRPAPAEEPEPTAEPEPEKEPAPTEAPKPAKKKSAKAKKTNTQA